MNYLIEDKREPLNQLCKRFSVQRLELFGSASDGRFDRETSDLDFLVEFLPSLPGDHKRVAVKIIDDRGIESLKIVEVG